MKKTNQYTDQNKHANNVRRNPDVSQSGGKMPENKDDLDSRKNKEYQKKKDILEKREDEPDFEP